MQGTELERHQLPGMIDGQGLRGIALGVGRGEYVSKVWQSGKFAEFWGVDPYMGRNDNTDYAEAIKQVGLDADFRLLHLSLDEAIILFPDGYFDFIYLDGAVQSDETAGREFYSWSGKLRVGGLIAGQGYHQDRPMVVATVDRFVADAGLSPVLTQSPSHPGAESPLPSWAAIKVTDTPLAYPSELEGVATSIASARKYTRNTRELPADAGIKAARSPLNRFRADKPKIHTSLAPERVARTAELAGTKRGKRCMIVGSAPSIRDLDLSQVQDCDLFFLNKAAKLESAFGDCERSLVLADANAIAEYGAELPIDRMDRLFFSADIPEVDHSDIRWFQYYKTPRIYDGFAQANLRKPLYHCHTVAAFAIQIAVGMGYSEILVAGIDLDFDEDETHCYAATIRERVWSRDISRPKASLMRAGIAYLAHWATRRGVKVINVSPKKSLPLVQTADLSSLFAGDHV